MITDDSGLDSIDLSFGDCPSQTEKKGRLLKNINGKFDDQQPLLMNNLKETMRNYTEVLAENKFDEPSTSSFSCSGRVLFQRHDELSLPIIKNQN